MTPVYIATLALNIAVNVVYGVLVLRDWRKQSPEIRRTQILNTMGILVALGFAQYFLAGYFYSMTKMIWRIPFDPVPLIFSVLVTLPGAIALVLRVIRPKTTERSEELLKLAFPPPEARQSPIRRDLLRKITHVVMFILIFAIDIIGFSILNAIFQDPYPYWDLLLNSWGYGPLPYILFGWRWDDWLMSGNCIAPSRIIVFGFLYCLTLVFLTGELCRHSTHWRYSFEKTLHRTLRARERYRIGAHALFAAGFLIASLFLPYFGIMGMLGGWSLGDLTASQVGMRWGRHQFLHQDKTWEGTIAGALVCFAAGWPFLGLAWAGTFTIVFMGIDLLTEKPVPMSDNLLLPIVGAVLFTLLQTAGIQVAPMFIALT